MSREPLHPMLWLNRILASPVFIIAVNIVFVVMIWRQLDEGKVDLVMSWFTMGMDQLIIAAGWIVLRKQNRHAQEMTRALGRIEKAHTAQLMLAAEVADAVEKIGKAVALINRRVLHLTNSETDK